MLSLLTRKYFVPVKRNGNLCEDSPRCNPQSLDNERCSGFNNKQINMFRLQLTSGDFFLYFSLSLVEALPSMNPHQMPLRWKFITQ